jgi:adenosylmethionine-8-amino-7-oxononanoate aminotransferase
LENRKISSIILHTQITINLASKFFVNLEAKFYLIMNTMTPTAQLQQADRDAIWHPFTPLTTSPMPLPIQSAKGAYLYTTDGRQIIDAIASWWVNLHGHSHPHIANAIATQAQRLEHVIFAGFTHEPAIQLAQRLLQILPNNQSKIFFSDNGSTATEVAMKMAFQYFHNQGIRRRKIIALEGAYHGDTFGAMSVGERSPFNAPFQPYLFEVEFIPLPTEENQTAVFQQFDELLASKDVAAFIFEPLVQGASGMRMYSAKLLDTLIQKAQAAEVICIADEVMTGFGRTGKLFASLHLQNYPDIICLSKGITGGFLPLGVTTCTEKIISAYREDDLMKTFFHGHSYTANPIVCAAANANLDLLLDTSCQADIQRISQEHQKFVEICKQYKTVENVRNLGTIFALDLVTSQETSYINEARSRLYPYFLAKNILLRPLGNVLYILPPYCIGNEDLQKIYKAILELVEK